jgi:hypothetical protein
MPNTVSRAAREGLIYCEILILRSCTMGSQDTGRPGMEKQSKRDKV